MFVTAAVSIPRLGRSTSAESQPSKSDDESLGKLICLLELGEKAILFGSASPPLSQCCFFRSIHCLRSSSPWPATVSVFVVESQVAVRLGPTGIPAARSVARVSPPSEVSGDARLGAATPPPAKTASAAITAAARLISFTTNPSPIDTVTGRSPTPVAKPFSRSIRNRNEYDCIVAFLIYLS